MSRYHLTKFEWRVIAPLLPNKPSRVARMDDRRVLNGIFWVLRSGSPWRYLPERYGPYTTCYNRFRRWTKAGVWYGVWMRCAHDRRYERVCPPCCRHLKKSHPDRCLGRSRGGLTAKIHALTDAAGLTVKIVNTPSQAHNIQATAELLTGIRNGQMVLADRAYDAEWLRAVAAHAGGWANIPPKRNRRDPVCLLTYLYRQRNLIATTYDKLGSSFLAMTKFACIRLRLRHHESMA
jgi:transposase